MDIRNNLIEKYLEGKTTLAEEESIFQNSNIENPGIENWTQYVKHHKNKIPKDFNNNLWNDKNFTIRNKKRKYYYIVVLILILSLIGIATYEFHQSEDLDYAAKKELLEQAIALTAPDVALSNYRHIIYEDDILIIYVTKP